MWVMTEFKNFSLTRPFTSSTMNRSNSFVESSYKIRGQRIFWRIWDGDFSDLMNSMFECARVKPTNQPTTNQPSQSRWQCRFCFENLPFSSPYHPTAPLREDNI
jgi:hypothetical protein